MRRVRESDGPYLECHKERVGAGSADHVKGPSRRVSFLDMKVVKSPLVGRLPAGHAKSEQWTNGGVAPLPCEATEAPATLLLVDVLGGRFCSLSLAVSRGWYQDVHLRDSQVVQHVTWPNR